MHILAKWPDTKTNVWPKANITATEKNFWIMKIHLRLYSHVNH